MLNHFQSDATALTQQQRALQSRGLREKTYVCDGVSVGIRKKISRFERDHEIPNTTLPEDPVQGADVKSTIMISSGKQRKVLHQLVVSSFADPPQFTVKRAQYDELMTFVEKNCKELQSYIQVSFNLRH